MFHKIKEVSPMDNYTLSVCFEDGVQKQFDVKPLFIAFPVFQTLQEIPNLFSQVQVDVGGYGISWNDELDLSCNDLWENGTPLTDNKIA